MGILSKLKTVYASMTGSGEKGGALDDDVELQLLDGELTDEESLLSEVSPEIRKFAAEKAAAERKGEFSASVQPKIMNIQLATDVPTATQVLTLLGMVRYAMETTAKTPGGEPMTISVSIRNRSGSPLLIGIGDTSIPQVPLASTFEIGS